MIGVCIVTYNQEKYIAQAIESVLAQVGCGHEVVAYVGNDCSTDRTGAICDEIASKVESQKLKAESQYADKRVKVIHNEKNLGLVGNTMNLLDIMRKDGCDYIAMLDGDDYWCDDHKLQKQMAYFDAHPEYGLVHTCVDTLYTKGIHVDTRTTASEGDVSYTIFNYRIGNCSVVFKTKLLDCIDFDEFQHQGFMSVDFIMYVIFSCYMQFGFLPDHTAVWRRGHDSVSNTNNMEKQIHYVQNDIAMWRYAAKLFPDRWHANEQELNDYLHYRSFVIAFKYGNRKRALAEAQMMSKEDRKKYRLKIWCTYSKLLMCLWRYLREKKYI